MKKIINSLKNTFCCVKKFVVSIARPAPIKSKTGFVFRCISTSLTIAYLVFAILLLSIENLTFMVAWEVCGATFAIVFIPKIWKSIKNGTKIAFGKDESITYTQREIINTGDSNYKVYEHTVRDPGGDFDLAFWTLLLMAIGWFIVLLFLGPIPIVVRIIMNIKLIHLYKKSKIENNCSNNKKQ